MAKYFILGFLFPLLSFGQELFKSHDVMNLTLQGDLTSAWYEREVEDREYWPLNLYVEGEAISIMSKIYGGRRATYYRARRGKKELICPYPNFKIKTQKQNEYFESGKSYYFVTHCNDNEKNPEQFLNHDFEGLIAGNNQLLREYMTYRMQSVLTTVYPKVRLAEISYVDTYTESSLSTKRFGFIVENFEEIGAKLGARVLDEYDEINLGNLDVEETLKQGIFEWFIGNGDFYYSGPRRHNFVMMQSNSSQTIIPMAHDFNETEIVEHEHNPYHRLPILIPCGPDNEKLFLKVLREMVNKEGRLIGLVEQSKYLSDIDRKFLTRYIRHQMYLFMSMEQRKSYTISRERSESGICKITPENF